MQQNQLKMEMEYHQRAVDYTKNQVKLGSAVFPTISPGMPEWDSWGNYFREYLGFDPLAMRRVRHHQQLCMTVPTQWPEWFDSTYTAGKGGHYIAPQRKIRLVDPRAREYRELLERYGKPHGVFDKERQLPYLAVPPTDMTE